MRSQKFLEFPRKFWKFVKYPKSLLKSIRIRSREVVDEYAKKDKLGREILENILKFQTI